MKNKTKHKYKIFFIIILLILSFCAFYNGLTIREYELYSEKISKPVSIVLITDLHSHIYGHNQQDLIDLAKKQKPDLILLAGDIADDGVPIEGTELFLDGVKDVCPVYYVTGNHEYWSNDINNIREIIQSYDVKILSDEYSDVFINGNALIIAGIDDPAKKDYGDDNYSQETSMQKAFLPLQEITGYRILMAHRPERIETYLPFNFDLVVSGHSHGGQVRIPFLVNGLWAPDQGKFPKYAGGMYTHGQLKHIVSRGISYSPKLPRVFNPPEIVVIHLYPIE